MNSNIKFAMSTYISKTAECLKFGWSAEFQADHLRSAYQRLYDVLRAEKPNFFNMSAKELTEYGFRRWSSDSTLMLIPLYLIDYFKTGDILTCIDGTRKVVGEDHIDNDTRFGCIAYGVFPVDKDGGAT